jgi:hypothetical protein
VGLNDWRDHMIQKNGEYDSDLDREDEEIEVDEA